jgi:hypothetical protein
VDDQRDAPEVERLEPGVEVTDVIDEAIAAAGRLARAPHADEVGSQTASGVGQLRDDVAPEIGRRRVAVQEHDGIAGPDVDVGHVGVEDVQPPPLEPICRREPGRRHGPPPGR